MEPPPLAEVEKMIRNVHRMKTEENKFQAVFDTVKERELTAKAASLSEYSDEGLVVATQELFHKRFEESVEYQKQIEYWIQEDPSRIEQFEEEIANMVNSGRKLGLGTLLVLGKFADKARHTSDKLAWELELSRGLTIDPETLDMLSALMQRNDEEANYAVHKVLDFFRQYMFTVQNRTGQNIEAKYGSYYGGMFQDLHRYVSRVQEEQYAQNYLVSRHIDDLAEMYCIVTGGEKEGVLIGVGGGAQDEIIYANRRAEESYKNQLKYGLVTHDPTIDVILPVAKGYVGLYQRGVLKEVFPERKDNVYDEQEFIDNYSNVQWPYEKIEDTLMDVYRPGNDSSIGLLVLQDLNDIGRYMREKGDLFFFDLLKVDKDRLHPYVYERILAMNSTTVAKVKGRERRTQSIDASMQEKLISPTRELTDQEQCLYEYCMSLQMRKKIEDDFGIDLGNLGLWQQRSFLSFIEKATVDQADDLRAFVEDYGEVGVSIFVAGEEDPQLARQRSRTTSFASNTLSAEEAF